jgi:hypothetical protein
VSRSYLRAVPQFSYQLTTSPDARGGARPLSLRSTQESHMRDINVVLREKEDAIKRVRQEVQALRSVTPLLADAAV